MEYMIWEAGWKGGEYGKGRNGRPWDVVDWLDPVQQKDPWCWTRGSRTQVQSLIMSPGVLWDTPICLISDKDGNSEVQAHICYP